MSKIKNAANYLIALLTVILLNFLVPRLVPGDPVYAIFGQCACINITPELRAKLIERFALDKPLWDQLAAYLKALLEGDFGFSYFYNEPVLKVILASLPWTLFLVGTAAVVSALAGIVLGLESGWRRGKSLDKSLLTGIMVFNGLPDFFIGIVLLLIFGVIFNVMPLAGGMTPYSGFTGPLFVWDLIKHFILPVTALTLVNLTGTFILTRNTMVTVLGEQFILTARAKGLPDKVIRYKHAGRNAMLPAVTRTGIQIGRMFTGALLVEMVFTYPGMGTLAYKALDARDYPLLQGIFLVVAVFVMAANFSVDLLYKKMDPRLKA